MKDLVPKGTGNSRFLRSSIPENITHAELVALLRAGTFPVDFAGLNAEGVAVVGSAYNKANVLPDDVCAALGLPTNIEPKDAFSALNKKGGWTELERITTSKTWTVPDGVTQIGVFLMGGGQSGAAKVQRNGASALGGCSGCIKNTVLSVTPGQEINVIIGAGGKKVTALDTILEGNVGGDTSFGDITAKGGGNPKKPLNGANEIIYGAQNPCHYPISEKALSGGSMMGFSATYESTIYFFDVPTTEICNCFSPMKVACAGASVNSSNNVQTNSTSDLGEGGTAANERGSRNITATAGSATGYGNGGGAATVSENSSTSTNNKAVSGAGSPGIVIIYV